MDEKLRILLCEDDENLGMLLREYLQAKGYAVELCPDGEAGYKAFLKNKYDLCVFDVMMPKKDGFTLAQEVRAANAEIPIIFLTAKTLKEDILEGFKIGADDYITKPFSMEELTFRIEAIWRRVRGKKNKQTLNRQKEKGCSEIMGRPFLFPKDWQGLCEEVAGALSCESRRLSLPLPHEKTMRQE